MAAPHAPVRVGLAGAGPWATMVHAPTFAAGPETELVGVWSRTSASAERLATAHGVAAYDDFDALVGASEAVALAVPPAVQPELARRVARSGRALVLEKPLAPDLAGADEVAGAVGDAGVGSLVVLTYRFRPVTRAFLASVREQRPVGGRGCFLSGAFLGGPFVGGWREAAGVVLDVGPHLLDLLDAALGPVVDIGGVGDPDRWVSLTLQHASGAVSEAALCCRAAIDSRTEVEVFGPDGALALDARVGDRDDAFATLRADLARIVRRGGGHECDAARGARVQSLVDAASRAVATGERVTVG